MSKLVEKVALRARALLAVGSQVSGGMNISPDCVAEAQLAACSSTRKHAMRLFPPVWTQKILHPHFSIKWFILLKANSNIKNENKFNPLIIKNLQSKTLPKKWVTECLNLPWNDRYILAENF